MTRDDAEQLRRWQREAAARSTTLDAQSVCTAIAATLLVVLVALLVVSNVMAYRGGAHA